MNKSSAGGAMRVAAVVAAALSCAAGCVSFHRYGETRTVRETRKENATGLLDARVKPVVDRDGRDAVVRFRVIGALTNTCEKSGVYERDEIGETRFGFFPGIRKEEPQYAVLAFWYNVCMLGAPTLNGLFAEWFRAPDESDGFSPAPHGAFRRSALFGYYSETFRAPRPKTVTGAPQKVVKAVDSLFLPVGPEPWQISVSVTGADASYGTYDGNDSIRLSGVYQANGEAGPGVLSAKLSVPDDYGLKAELADDEREPVEIRL